MGDIALRGQGRALLKKGGRAKDMSMKHEGMESMAEEAKETKLEKKGFRETKSGKMVKAAKGGSMKKGILIIIGNKDKKSKGMKKGGLAKQAAIAIAMKKAGKKPKEMKK